MVCFLAFSVAALAVAPVADAPRSALRFAVGYLVMAAVAVIAGGVFAPRTLVRGALASLLIKVGISLAIAAFPIAWWEPGPRFRGMLGNPNPMGTTAGLAFLLLVLHGWYDGRTSTRRWFVVLGAVVATATHCRGAQRQRRAGNGWNDGGDGAPRLELERGLAPPGRVDRSGGRHPGGAADRGGRDQVAHGRRPSRSRDHRACKRGSRGGRS